MLSFLLFAIPKPFKYFYFFASHHTCHVLQKIRFPVRILFEFCFKIGSLFSRQNLVRLLIIIDLKIFYLVTSNLSCSNLVFLKLLDLKNLESKGIWNYLRFIFCRIYLKRKENCFLILVFVRRVLGLLIYSMSFILVNF